jgi:1-acyl-sn-glycerol-3-phosphate acyltransferase
VIVLRSAVFNVWFFGVTALLGAIGIFVRAFIPRRTLAFARFWARSALFGARWIVGIDVDITGYDRLPAGSALLASQHQSAFDTLIWVVMLPRCSYVFKAELGDIPLFGPMLEASGQIPIDRGASIAAVRSLIRGTQAAKEAGRQIVIFPEGTRVAHGVEAEIRGGFSMIAARTGLPIYPVSTDSGRYWSRRSFIKRPGRVRIHIGEPIPYTLRGPELVTTLKQRWSDAGLTVPVVDNSVDEHA